MGAPDPTDEIEPRLVDAAHRTIERHGWHDTTLERIAAEAGVSRMTLHRHRVSRQTLLRALAGRLERQHREAMLEVLAGPGSGRERLGRAMAAECEVTERNLNLAETLGTAARDAIYHEDGLPALSRAAFTAPYRRLLEDGVADGSLRTTDPDQMATVLINLVTHTYGHLRRGHAWDPERARNAVCSTALDGVSA